MADYAHNLKGVTRLAYDMWQHHAGQDGQYHAGRADAYRQIVLHVLGCPGSTSEETMLELLRLIDR